MTALPEMEVRLARARFNEALAQGDLDAIEPLLAPAAVLVTGTDSAVIAGRKAQLLAWKREFAAAARTVYTRLPDRITLSPVEPIALEEGRWRGVAVTTGSEAANGVYSAKWRRGPRGWTIEAEIYVTLA